MREPERLIAAEGAGGGGAGTALEQLLLTAARRERPPLELQLRMARMLGIPASMAVPMGADPIAPSGLEVAPMAGKGAAGAGAVATSLSGSMLALLSAGVLTSLLAAGLGVRAMVRRTSREAEHIQTPADVVPRGGTSSAPTASAVAPVSASAATAGFGTGGLGTGTVSEDVADEVRLLDLARAALREGAPARALQHLDEHAQRHPQGALLPEAAVMRIEALTREGDRARAAALARQFLAHDPDSPLRAWVERLLAPPSR